MNTQTSVYVTGLFSLWVLWSLKVSGSLWVREFIVVYGHNDAWRPVEGYLLRDVKC